MPFLDVKSASDARDRAPAATVPTMNTAYGQARADFNAAKAQTVIG